MSFVTPTTGEPEEVINQNSDLVAAESGYVAPTVEADQDAIAQQVFTNLASRVSGWTASDGNLDTWLVESFAEVGAEIRSLCASVPASIFQTYGLRVLGVPPDPALAATGTATVTAFDDLGYTLDVGTTFAVARSGNDLVAFATIAPATIPAGSTTVSDVPFAAVITGGDANGLGGTAQLLDPITWISTVAVQGVTAGGADAETAQAYLDRLANLMSMMALRPILPQDFAILALQEQGVGRAIAMNLYDPATNTWTNPRTISLLLTDDGGLPCSPDVKANVQAQLEALREVNWVVHVIDPTYAAIDVAFACVAYIGQDQDTVLAACVSNLTRYLQPANFRLGELSPAIAGGEVINPPTTGAITRRQTIRINELIALLDRSLGVDYVVSATINGASVDFQLPNCETLPQPGLITGTVTGGNP